MILSRTVLGTSRVVDTDYQKAMLCCSSVHLQDPLWMMTVFCEAWRSYLEVIEWSQVTDSFLLYPQAEDCYIHA